MADAERAGRDPWFGAEMLDAFRRDGISTPAGHIGGAMLANGLQNLAVLAGFVESFGRKPKGGRKTVTRG